jgi:hypothetical protein
MLEQIPGERIRRQYFNIPIYLILSFSTPILIYLFSAAWKYSDSVTEDYLSFLHALIILYLHILIPLVILSVLNRFCFGKVVCVLNKKGIYFYDHKVICIPWSSIKEVTYAPNYPDTHRSARSGYNSVKIATMPFKKTVITEIRQVPFYLLGKMKAYCPNVKYRIEKFDIICMLSIALIPSAIVIFTILFE